MYPKYTKKEKLAKIRKEFLDSLKTVHGRNLNSVIIYGSILSGGFDPNLSDINLLILLNEANPEQIIKMGKYCAKMIKECNITPMVMSIEEFRTSADIFPMEYYDIKEFHETIFGEDAAEKIIIEGENLRHQTEERLRGCINSLRQILMFSGGDPETLFIAAKNTKGICNTIFRSILRLKRFSEISLDYEKNIKALNKYIDFNTFTFMNLQKAAKDNHAEEMICDLLLQLLKIVNEIDKTDIEK